MWNARDHHQNGETRQGEGVVAVAVDKEKSSQFAIKWAVDNLFPRTNPLKLIHVVNQISPSSNPGVAGNNSDIVTQHEPDTQGKGMEVFLPYRCFCTRRKVPFETDILHNPDVARALIDYISLGGVSTLILGTLSRNGLSRIFKNSDVSSSVLKKAPNFCNVYIISKGKVSAMRPASRSAQAIHAVEPIHSNVNHYADPGMLYDELSVVENDNSITTLSIDSDYVSFYENLESGLVGPSSEILNSDNGNFEPLFSSSKSVKVDTMKDYSCSEGPLFSLEDVEDEVRRHKLELKEAMGLYHAACREAQVSKQKMIELQDWNMKQEQRLKEAESEIARYKAAIEAEKMLAEKEMENRVLKAEIKAMIDADERKKVFYGLRQSHTVIKYQTLFHALVVLSFFYLYFSSF